MDDRIFKALDFIGFNVYLPDYPEVQEAWQNTTVKNIISSGNKIYAWITEFGYFTTSNSTDQANSFSTLLKLFASLSIS